MAVSFSWEETSHRAKLGYIGVAGGTPRGHDYDSGAPGKGMAKGGILCVAILGGLLGIPLGMKLGSDSTYRGSEPHVWVRLGVKEG